MNSRIYVFAVLVAVILGGVVVADGMFVWNRGADLNEPSQKAIIHWAKDVQTMILQVKYEGEASNFGWIVPLPSKPEVSAIEADESPFAEISYYTQIRQRWGSRSKGAAGGVEVLERKKVGVYDIAILSAADSGGLAKWLKKNGFVFPEGREDILDHYTKKKWVYAAIRIDASELVNDEVKKLKVGELQPVRFRFASKEMVYPLKISSANSGKTELLLYLLSERPMIAKSQEDRKRFRIEENISIVGRIYYGTLNYVDYENGTYRKEGCEALPLTWKALGVAEETKLSLCRYRSVYTSEEMVDDVVFEFFDAMGYWKKRFSKEPLENSNMERDRQMAFNVLAWHDSSIIEEFAKDEHRENRAFAADHPKTSEKLLLGLANDDYYMVTHCLVYNRNMPQSVLLILAKNKDDRLRGEVARHPNTSLEMLEGFVKDQSADVRDYALMHHAITAEMLEYLSKDKDMKVRRSVAGNKNTPIEVLIKLARDESSEVRAQVAKQSRLPGKVQEELLLDSSMEVRRMASIHGNNLSVETLVKLANDSDPLMRWGAARNAKTPVELLRKLAGDSEAVVRQYTAGNAKTPLENLLVLANDSERWVRASVARNRRSPASLLKKLSQDENADVRRNVADNENTPEAVLRILAKDRDYHISSRASRALAKRGE